MSRWLNTLVVLFVISLFLRFWGFPFLLRQRTHFRVSRISPLSVKGLEWRRRAHLGSVVPDLKVGLVHWAIGGCGSGEIGLFVLKLENISFRIRRKGTGDQAGHPTPHPRRHHEPPPPPGRFSTVRSRLTSAIIHLLVHHYPSFARLISIQLNDVRIIFDEFDGMEVMVGSFRLGTTITFEGETEPPSPATPSSTTSPTSPESPGRNNPLAHLESPLSPGSPVYSGTPLGSFGQAVDDSTDTPPVVGQSPAKAVRSRRRAARLSATAGAIWSRAIARASGSVSVHACIFDVAVILPTTPAKMPLAPRASLGDLKHTRHQSSMHSLRSRKNSEAPSIRSGPRLMASAPSFSSILRPTVIRQPSHLPEEGYEALLRVCGDTKIIFGMGFGPKKGLLAEDTLNTTVVVGEIRTTTQAGERMKEIMAARKKTLSQEKQVKLPKPNRARPRWTPHSLPRIILRAIESVSFSLTSAHVSHEVPVVASRPVSAHSSTTSLSSMAFSDESTGQYVLAAGITGLRLSVSAADSANNQRAKNAFGTNASPASRIRGVALGLQWSSISVTCQEPGQEEDDRSDLLSVQHGDIEGMTTFRPPGWTREELLFPTDPNLSLIVGRSTIGSIDARLDLRVVDELQAALQDANSAAPSPSPPPEQVLKPPRSPMFRAPPRLRMVLDIGHMMLIATNEHVGNRTTISLASDGLHIGTFSGYSDVIARRRNITQARNAIKAEDELQERRKQEGEAFDDALPDVMIKPQLRRATIIAPAMLQEDLSISMSAVASIEIEPVRLQVTLHGKTLRDQRTFQIGEIGRIHGEATGDVLGVTEIQPDGSDEYKMDLSSAAMCYDLGVDGGIRFDLWHSAVIDALIAMTESRRKDSSASEPKHRKPRKDLLGLLPSGMNGRISLGRFSAFLGYTDPNPECPVKLVRGLWLQTTVALEYARYEHAAQAKVWRHHLSNDIRAKLSLPLDLSQQALAYYNDLSPKGGSAALFSTTVVNTTVHPIFNGARFVQLGGTGRSESLKGTEMPLDGSYPNTHPDRHVFNMGTKWKDINAPHDGTFANNIPPLEITDSEISMRPLLKIPRITAEHVIRRETANSDLEHWTNGKMGLLEIVTDLCHIYCAMLAVDALKHLVAGLKRTRASDSPSSASPAHTDSSNKHEDGASRKATVKVKLDLSLEHASIYMAFPLGEHCFLYFKTLRVRRASNAGVTARSDQVNMFVPNPKMKGEWEELGKLKLLEVQTTPPGQPIAFKVKADAFGLSIPYQYHMAKLILNANVTIKSIKLFRQDMSSAEFSFVRTPGPEEPKKVPRIDFEIKLFSVQFEDSPFESAFNTICRTSLAEQGYRNDLEDAFQKKVALIRAEEKLAQMRQDIGGQGEEETFDPGLQLPQESRGSGLTAKNDVGIQEARYRLDWYMSKSWMKHIDEAKEHTRTRAASEDKPMYVPGPTVQLPIRLKKRKAAVPLFRAEFLGVRLGVSNPNMTRDEIIDYMGNVSDSPFKPDVQFSLMVPLRLQWTMAEATIKLRDYPLPLVRVHPCQNVPHGEYRPAWEVDTPFIIAEELAGDDSSFFIPCEIIPAGLGAKDAKRFEVKIAKTIMPVKTYTNPDIHIRSERTTEFTWGYAYQPAIQDVTKVFETLTHPPRDPSERIGFWDKFRMILHWSVQIRFSGPAHLHLKGTYDPYEVTGVGAGFALSWRHNVVLNINRKNAERELIWVEAKELLVAMPDLTALHEVSGGKRVPDPPMSDEVPGSEQSLIARRYTKPCARFLNGVRFGLSFVFERTCRPWNCKAHCGQTSNLLHRQCREFHFKKHQEVILRDPDALQEMEKEIGHTVDSYEGFRSDYIHFGVSVTAANSGESHMDREAFEALSSLCNSVHVSPRASSSFKHWWRGFDHTMGLPIRQGSMFPESPPSSKKFGRSLATIKYRFSLDSLYISHMYTQVSPDMWDKGQSQMIGVKCRIGKLRADAHQRLQEKRVWNEPLQKMFITTHKPFHAAELQITDIEVKALRALFQDRSRESAEDHHDEQHLPKRIDELDHKDRLWYNFFDYIDAGQRPFDQDPRLEVVPLIECPKIFISRRNYARETRPDDLDEVDRALDAEVDGDEPGRQGPQSPQDEKHRLVAGHHGDAGKAHPVRRPNRMPTSDDKSEDSVGWMDVEYSKFGHEPTHRCLIGSSLGVNEAQVKITEHRLDMLTNAYEDLTKGFDNGGDIDQRRATMVVMSRIKTLERYRDSLIIPHERDRRTRSETIDTIEDGHPADFHGNRPTTALARDEQRRRRKGEDDFENTVHIHNPRVNWDNLSRTLAFKYLLSVNDRRREEYLVSWASIASLKRIIERRIEGMANEKEHTPLPVEEADAEKRLADILQLLTDVVCDKGQSKARFELPIDLSNDHHDFRDPYIGIPHGTMVVRKYRILVLKPQIALRSDVDKDSCLLLTGDEVSFKGHQILDKAAKDEVSAEIMTRGYVSMSQMQAFYPNNEVLSRERGATGVPVGFGFLPLEIFLDVRGESMDYERILLKTDAALHLDRFNHIRMPQGLHWPDAKTESSESMDHLRLHQDKTTITVPRMSLSANARTYSALYNVITDLLMYQDPQHRERSKQIDDFLSAYDRRDRHPQQFISEVFQLQSTVRELDNTRKGYELNFDLLDKDGRAELFNIRTDLLRFTEHIFTTFAAVRINQTRLQAKSQSQNSSITDIRLGGVSWHVLNEDNSNLAKMDISNILFTQISNKDGSTDTSTVIRDLSALNMTPDAEFDEIISRYSTDQINNWTSGIAKMIRREQYGEWQDWLNSVQTLKIQPIFKASWRTDIAVGGIVRYPFIHYGLMPINLKLDGDMGSKLYSYFMEGRTEQEEQKEKNKKKKIKGKDEANAGDALKANGKANGSRVDLALSRSRSTTSIYSLSRSNTDLTSESMRRPGQRMTSMTGSHAGTKGEGLNSPLPLMSTTGDVQEMTQRARGRFHLGKLTSEPTVLVLTYVVSTVQRNTSSRLTNQPGQETSDMLDNRGVSFGIKWAARGRFEQMQIKVSPLNYENKIWTMHDMAMKTRDDILVFAALDIASLTGQLIKRGHIDLGYLNRHKRLRHKKRKSESEKNRAELATHSREGPIPPPDSSIKLNISPPSDGEENSSFDSGESSSDEGGEETPTSSRSMVPFPKLGKVVSRGSGHSSILRTSISRSRSIDLGNGHNENSEGRGSSPTLGGRSRENSPKPQSFDHGDEMEGHEKHKGLKGFLGKLKARKPSGLHQQSPSGDFSPTQEPGSPGTSVRSLGARSKE